MSPTVLVVDDEESIRYTFSSFLAKERLKVLSAADYDEALGIISETGIDLLFLDIILSGRTGIDILKEVKERGMDCPVIMITGAPDIKTAAEAVRLGAFDYLPKPIRKNELVHVTRQALQYKTVLDDKRRIERERERYRRNLDAVFRSLRDAIVTVDEEIRVTQVNEAAKAICGFSSEEVIGKGFTTLPTSCNRACHTVLLETLNTRKTVWDFRIECARQDRSGQVVLLTGSPLTDKNGRFFGAVLVARDITRLNDLERELKERYKFQKILGKNRRMQEIYRLIEDLADTSTTVLITGESGTGKELVARALHFHGLRALQPFVKINCSALAESLLESELFGHVKGAFTGAVKDKQGRFEAADGGTVFLDEIGDISPRIALKLLRVLEDKEFERVGDASLVSVDVRVVAATNQDLRKKVQAGEFREDLFYRLKVVQVEMPPLRERKEDIPLLIDHFRDAFNRSYKKDIEGVSDDVLRAFMGYQWPGNVRELEHAIEQAFVLCHGTVIGIEHLPPEIVQGRRETERIPGEEAKQQDFELLLSALKKAGWNKAKAARILGVSRQTIYRMIASHNLPQKSPVM
jgi:two-component system response regulator HydG